MVVTTTTVDRRLPRRRAARRRRGDRAGDGPVRRRDRHGPRRGAPAQPGGRRTSSRSPPRAARPTTPASTRKALDQVLEAADYAELRAEQAARRERGDAVQLGHRRLGVRRDHRRRRVHRGRPGRGAPRRHGHGAHRHLAARPGARHGVGDAGERAPRHPDREDHRQARRHRPDPARRAAPWARAACRPAASRSTRPPASWSSWPSSAPPTCWRRTSTTSRWSTARSPVRGTGTGVTLAAAGRAASSCRCDTRVRQRRRRRSRSARTSPSSRSTWSPARRWCDRIITVDDAGPVLNPLLADGQRHGGIAQGIAQALLEEVVYDEDGNPLTATFADYAFPSAAELPSFTLRRHGDADPPEPVGGQGDRRGRHDRRHPGRAERGDRRASPTSGCATSTCRLARCGSGRRSRLRRRTLVKIEMTVNGEATSADVEPRLLLAHYLRDVLGLKATNIGCDTTSCGACTVLLDGESVKSCTVLAVQADGSRSPRSKGSADGPDDLHPVPAAFRAEHGLQCGFCTPGHGDGGGRACSRRTRSPPSGRSGRGWRATSAAAPATTTSCARCSPRAGRTRTS